MIAKRPAVRWRTFVMLAVVLCATTLASAAPSNLALQSDGDALWLLRTDTASDEVSTTTIRRRVDAVTGTWSESGGFAGRFANAAAIDGRLAVLRDDGSWLLAWDGHTFDGPTPGGRVLRLAGDGRTLWAVVAATRPGDPGRLCSWTEADGWRTVTSLPTDPSRVVSLAVYAARPWLASVDGKAIAVSAWDGRTWTAGSNQRIDGQSGEFVTGSPRPLLLVREGDGRSTLWRADGLPPSALGGSISLPRPAGVAMVGPMLRMVYAQGNTLQQATIDDYGTGRSSGPLPLAEPGTIAPRPFELVNLLVLGVLTVAMLRSIRSADALPSLPPGMRIAPLGRRAAAAILDATPLIAAVVWAFSRFDGSPEHLREQSERVFLPVFAGGLLYLTHVTAGEARFGKSLGKKLFGLRVVTLDGERPRIESVFVRNLMRALDAFVLPALLPLVSPGGRRIGDMAAGTVVVAAAPGPPADVDAAA